MKGKLMEEIKGREIKEARASELNKEMSGDEGAEEKLKSLENFPLSFYLFFLLCHVHIARSRSRSGSNSINGNFN
jgi:hypothetical protein